MIECWPGRRTSFMKSGMCAEFWSGQGERDRQRAAIGKTACFDVQAVVEIEGVKAGPTRAHIALRNLRVERSKTRTGSRASESITSGVADLELALVFEKPGRYTLPIHDITRIRCKYLHQGKATIEARDSLFLLSAVSQNELERLLEVIRDVKTVKILADSRVCVACKEKAERKKDKQKREQQQPTDFVPNSWLDGDFPPTKKQKVKVLECIFRKKQMPDLDIGQEQVNLRDLLRRRERDHASQKLNKVGMFPPEGRDARPIDVEEEVYFNSNGKSGGTSPAAEGTKQDNVYRKSPVQTNARDAHVVKPTSPIRRVIFIDEIKRRNSEDSSRRREAQRIVSERRRDLESGLSERSSDEKENFEDCVDDDVRKFGEETMKRLAEERRCLDEVLRKVQEGHRRLDDASKRNEDRRPFDVEDKRWSQQKESLVKRKESLRKLVDEESKWKEEWEAKREEDLRWTEEEDEKKLKADEEKVKKSLDRRLQEEDRRRKEENKMEEEIRKGEERRKKCLDRILQEEKRRRIEEDRRVQGLKQREEEGLRAREAERKVHELKQREEEGIRAREAERKSQELKQRAEEDRRNSEADRKFQEQMQETRKQAEEKLKEALKYFKLEERFQGLREQEELRKFQEAIKNTVRLSQRDRNRSFDEARMSAEELRRNSNEQRDNLQQRKLDEDMRRWRTDENQRRAKEDGRILPHQERLVLEEQRKRVEEVMNMSKRLHRKIGESVNDEVERSSATFTKADQVHNFQTEGKQAPPEDEPQNIGFHERVFMDEFPTIRDNQRARVDEKRERNEGEWFNLTEIFAKPSERARQEELRKQELQRKKAAKAADDQKKKEAQERLKAAKLEAKRLEKLLKEAQKRAKAEERVKQQQKAQEQTRQKVAVNAFERIPRVRHVTYQQYEDLWNVMKMSGKSSTLRYADIPWPPHDNPLFFEEGDSLAAQRRKLRIALLRWHPDKFVSLCGNRLSPLERECIEARAKNLAQEVIQWKGKLDNIS